MAFSGSAAWISGAGAKVVLRVCKSHLPSGTADWRQSSHSPQTHSEESPSELSSCEKKYTSVKNMIEFFIKVDSGMFDSESQER